MTERGVRLVIFFETWTEDTQQDNGFTKPRSMWKCILCGLIKVFKIFTRIRNHLSTPGDAEQFKNSSDIGPCPFTLTAVNQKFYQLLQLPLSKAHEKTAAVVSATACAALEAAAAAATADAANGGENTAETDTAVRAQECVLEVDCGEGRRHVRGALLRRPVDSDTHHGVSVLEGIHQGRGPRASTTPPMRPPTTSSPRL